MPVHDTIDLELHAHYGDGFLVAALHDIVTARHKAKAVEIVASNMTPAIGASYGNRSSIPNHTNIAWRLISGRMENMYSSVADAIKNVSWKLLVDLGNVPEHIDAMLNRLKRISNSSNIALVRLLNWVGEKIGDVWTWLGKILGPSFYSLFDIIRSNTMSFNWLVSTIGSGVKFLARQITKGLIIVYRALRSIVDSAVESMAGAIYMSMEAVLNSTDSVFEKSRHAIVKTLMFVVSFHGDIFRNPRQTIPELDQNQDGFINQYAKLIKSFGSLVHDSKSVRTLESNVRVSPFYSIWLGSAFDAIASVTSWIVEKIAWFYNTLLRIKSVGRTVLYSTLCMMSLLNSSIGTTLQEAFDEFKTVQKLNVSLNQKAEILDNLKADVRLSATTHSSLEKASDTTKQVIQDFETIVEKMKNTAQKQKETERFAPNLDAAEALADLFIYGSTNFERVDRINKHYYGRSFVDHFSLMREAHAYADTQILMATGELMSFANIGGKTKPSAVRKSKKEESAIVPLSDDEDENAMVLFRKKEDPTFIPRPPAEIPVELSTLELQRLLREKEERLSALKKSLIEYELENGKIRDAKYELVLGDIQKMNQSSSEMPRGMMDIIPYELEEVYAAIVVKRLGESDDAYIYAKKIAEVVYALEDRNKVAERLGKKMENASSKKATLISIAFIFNIIAYGALFYLIYLAPGSETSSAVESTNQAWFESLGGFASKAWNSMTISGVSVMDTFNPLLWIGFAKRLSRMDAGLVAQLPKMGEYVTLALGLFPAAYTVVVSLFSMQVISVCWFIDWRQEIGLEISINNSEVKEIVYSQPARSKVYGGMMRTVLGKGIVYATLRYVNTCMITAFKIWKNLKDVTSTIIGMFASGGNVLGNVAGLLNRSSTSFTLNLEDIDLRRLLIPPKHIRDAIRPITFESLDANVPRRKTLEQFFVLELPQDHDLRTGAAVKRIIRSTPQLIAPSSAAKTPKSRKVTANTDDTSSEEQQMEDSEEQTESSFPVYDV